MRAPLILTSLDNPRLKRLVRLRKQRERRGEGVFIAEGVREIERALGAGLTIRELFWSPELTGITAPNLHHSLPNLHPDRPTAQRNAPNLSLADPQLYQITPPLAAKVSYCENPEGILAVFDQPAWTLDSLPLDPARPDVFLIAHGISKPGNLGAMARTASAAGATALLTADAVVDPFNPNAIRASTGAVFTLPIVGAPTGELLDFLRRRATRLLAATPDAAKAYWDADLRGPVALVIGAEDAGVGPEFLAAADEAVTIPMSTGTVDSLNASNAAAIVLFEALRQRARP